MLNEKSKALETVGLQKEGMKIKAVHLALEKSKIVLKDLYSIDINSDGTTDPINFLDLTEQGKKLTEQIKKHLSYTAISSSETLIRTLFVQLKKDKDIQSVVQFQAEPIIPFAMDACVIDWMKIDQVEDGSNLVIFAVKKEHIIRHIEEWKQFNIDPECISVVPAAIASFATYFLPHEDSYYIVHIGYKTTTCVLVYNKKLIAAQFIPKGIEDLIEALKQDETIDDEQAISRLSTFTFSPENFINHPAVASVAGYLRIEVMKIFFGLSKQLKGEELSKVLITGEGGALSGMRLWLTKELKKEALEIIPRDEFSCDAATLLRYDVPIGLALSGLPKVDFQIDLRMDELAYPKPWKRMIKPLIVYFATCLLFAWGVYFSSKASFGYQEDQVKEKFGSLLSIMNKSYVEFEKEYEKKTDDTLPEPIENLTIDELFDRLNFLNEEIEKAPQPIALLPNTPRVSDVLAWLATHPNVVFTGDNTIERKPLVQIQHFDYSLLKRPEEKKRNNRYQVKIELEFTSPTPKLAREFHDALIEDSTFVDTKGEVKWSSNRGLYRTSFYLVDKTFYPSTFNPQS